MEQNIDAVKRLYRDWGWLVDHTKLMGRDSRPLSLFSHRAVKLLGLRVLDRDAEYESDEDEIKEWKVYCWLHTSPLAEVQAGLEAGAWELLLQGEVGEVLDALPEIREQRLRLVELVNSCEFTIKKRERPGANAAGAQKENRPLNSLSPDWLSLQVQAVMMDTGMKSLDEIWGFPYFAAMRIFHARVFMEWSGIWTIEKREISRQPSESDFENLGECFLNSEPDENTEENEG